MNDKNKIKQEVNQEAIYSKMKRDMFGGMLRDAGLSEKEIENTLKNDIKPAIEYTAEELEELESKEFKQWERQEAEKKANREKSKR